MILQKIRRAKEEIDTFYETLLSTEDTTSRRALLTERRVVGPYGAMFGPKNALRSLGAKRMPGGSLRLILGSRKIPKHSTKHPVKSPRKDAGKRFGGRPGKGDLQGAVILLAELMPDRRTGNILSFTVWRESPEGRMSLTTHPDATQALIDYHGQGRF